MTSLSLTNEQLAQILTSALEANPHFLTICELVRANATENVWLIGGAVSRTLACELYGTAHTSYDFDFVTDGKLVDDEIVPDGWELSHEKFGNPTFTHPETGVSVDLWPISTHEYIVAKKLSPTIEHLFLGMPYTIQMIAYNLKTKQLIGDVGLSALRTKQFAVNNSESAYVEATRKGVTVPERMQAKAKSMGFTVVLP